MEITETIDLKNFVLIVKENEQKHIPNLQNYIQTNCSSVVPMLVKSTGITLQQFV